jgi:hypothetical protein
LDTQYEEVLERQRVLQAAQYVIYLRREERRRQREREIAMAQAQYLLQVQKLQPFDARVHDPVEWIDEWELIAPSMGWDTEPLRQQNFWKGMEKRHRQWARANVCEVAAVNTDVLIRTAFLLEFKLTVGELLAKVNAKVMKTGEEIEDYIQAKTQVCLAYDPVMPPVQLVNHIINGLTPAWITLIGPFPDPPTPAALTIILKKVQATERLSSSVKEMRNPQKKSQQGKEEDRVDGNKHKYKHTEKQTNSSSSERREVPHNSPRKGNDEPRRKDKNYKERPGNPRREPPKAPRRDDRPRRSLICFNCGIEGHMRPECPHEKEGNGMLYAPPREEPVKREDHGPRRAPAPKSPPRDHYQRNVESEKPSTSRLGFIGPPKAQGHTDPWGWSKPIPTWNTKAYTGKSPHHEVQD